MNGVDTLDLFAGPGGWSVAAKALGLVELGADFDEAACATARAAGHLRHKVDIARLDPSTFTQRYRGQIASPPCQGFSMAGKGAGRFDSEMLIEAAYKMESGHDPRAELHDRMHDDCSVLALEPLRFALALEPEWVALEQVPAVLPLWEAVAGVLRRRGYSAWTGFLTAEMYDVPQTRKRAILIASRVREIDGPPPPTRSRYYSRTPGKLDPGMPKWISMAEALGWGVDDRVGFLRRSDGREEVVIDGQAYRARDLRSADLPAQVVTEKARSWERYRAAVAAEVEPRVNNQSGTKFDLSWPADRPAPVVAGREIITMPGANANRFNGATKSRNDGIRVTVQEAGVLQSFPVDYPWQGTRTDQFRQVGDAVPPRLAWHILKHAMGA